MADYDWPDALAPYAAAFYLQTHSVIHTSPLTRQQQVLARTAPRYVCRMSLRGMEDDKGAALDGFLTKLRGPQNRVLLYDYRRPVALGDTESLGDWLADVYGDVVGFSDTTEFSDGTGFAVTFTGDFQTVGLTASGSTSFVVTGHKPNVTVFKAGDRIGWHNHKRIYTVTEDAVADGIDNLTVYFEPPLKDDVPAGTAPVTTKPRAPFRLTTDDAGNNPTDVEGLSSFELDFVEDLS